MDLTDSIGCLSIDKQTPTNIKTFAAIIENNHTEFVVSYFQNNITYIITQFEKLGNLYSVETEQVDNGIIDSKPVYSLRPLLGGDNIEVEAGVRYIAQELNPKKTLLISLTLKDYKVQTIKFIVEAIKNYRTV